MPITTAADDILIFFFLFLKENTKMSLDISCELSAMQMIQMKYQDLSSKKKIRMSSATNFAWHFKG